MDGLQDAKNQAGEGAAQQPQGGNQAQHAQTSQLTGMGGGTLVTELVVVFPAMARMPTSVLAPTAASRRLVLTTRWR